MVTSTLTTTILSMVNIKGGVVKSVSSLFVAWGLALSGYRIYKLALC